SPTKEDPVPLERRLVLEPVLLWEGAQGLLVRTFDHQTKMLKPEERVSKPLAGVVGLGLVIHAPAALPRFAGEAGFHVFRTHTAQASGNCLVDTSQRNWQDYEPPPGMDRRGNIGQQERRRTYDFSRGTLEDVRLPGKMYANPDNLSVVLASALDRCLKQNLKE